MLVRCPAKINLFLSVGPRDRRGYHPIRSVFQAISLYDELEIELAKEDRFESDIPLPALNTVTRCLALLREPLPVPPLAISLRKGIPSEAGLGGGSSDAAGLVRGVEALLGTRMPDGERMGIATAIGADVPFFLGGGRARAEGYGERLTPLPDDPVRWLVVAKPPVGCPTGPMYAALDQREYPWRDWPDGDELYNDFERVAPCECLDLIDRLRINGADDAGLSGSGSAVFGRFPSEFTARTAAERIRSEDVGNVFVCRTLTRSESLTAPV